MDACCALTDNNSAFLNKIFKIREKIKSTSQPIEAISTPQTHNLPVVETNKTPQIKNKKKRISIFGKPAQKRYKRGPAVVRAGMRDARPYPVNPGIKSAWAATTMLTIGSVYHAVIGTTPSNVIKEHNIISNSEQIFVGRYDVFCDMLCLILLIYQQTFSH